MPGTRRDRPPAQAAWALELLAPQPGERLLEVGCGPGVLASLLCQQPGVGTVTALDRSATAVARTARHGAAHVRAGRLEVVRGELATHPAEPGTFDAAVDVNVFWTAPGDDESRALWRALRPGGRVVLVWGGPGPSSGRGVGPRVVELLGRHGFDASSTDHPDGSLLAVTGRR